MNIFNRCRIIHINHLTPISRNSSVLVACKSGETPEEENVAWSDSNVAQASEFRRILQLCARDGASMGAKACHGKIIRSELQGDVTLSNVLINSYSKCGLVGVARQVFDKMPERSLVSWNTMIGLYTLNKHELEALKIFFDMRKKGVVFNEFTISSVLRACVAKCDALDCKLLHGVSVKTCLDSNLFVGTALLDLYAKCGLIKEAVQVFESMEERSSVTWSSIIAGYVQNKLYEDALLLFRRAQRLSLEPNQFTISSVICACASLAALTEGKQIHAVIFKTGINSNVFVASSIIDMYAKCGNMREAYVLFSEVEEKTIVLWNAVMSGFAKHARSLEVMILFEKMQQDGINPNEFTFVSLLSALGHTGLVKKGRSFFNLMKTQFNISPNVIHYSCLVDILGRAGHLSEAYELIQSMPFDPTASVWGSLLASCRVYKNLELAKVAAKNLFELEPENAGNHVLLSNIYAANKKWDAIVESRKLLKESNLKKIRGKSWIEVKNKVHTFNVADSHHSRIHEIHAKLDDLLNDMKRYGYEPDIKQELHDVEEGQKKMLLRHHSEKLALVFGLMFLPQGCTIRIMKNLRICVDCHEFMKVASMATRRCIIVRDVNRFHHFCDGLCSCGEFW